MWIEKLAVTAQEAFKSAMDIASKHEAATTEPLHLLAAILSADENNLKAIITRIGADPAVLKQRVDTEVEHQPKVSGQTFMGMVASAHCPFGGQGPGRPHFERCRHYPQNRGSGLRGPSWRHARNRR